MQTVLLADDERVFKALEGTCLRREVCRLAKTSPARLVEAATAAPPDLIVLVIDGDEALRALLDLRGCMALSSIPIIALDVGGASRATRAVIDARGGTGLVDHLVVRKRRSGGIDLAALDRKLDEAIKRRLPILNRKVDRVVVSVPVRCRGEGFTFTVRTKNISPSGLFLKTERDLSPGDRIRVRFQLPAGVGPGKTWPVAATCQVVRRVGSGGADLDLIPGIGVRFIDLEKDARTVLRDFIRTGSSPARTAGRATPRSHTEH